MGLTSVMAPHEPVLQETVRALEGVGRRLAVMATMKAPTLRHKHWEAIFDGQTL